jgi:hypothetical protein
MRGTNVLIGATIGDSAGWDLPDTDPPDGCFAILRADARRVELVADPVASRTIWYTLAGDRLIASTSQRAIIALLGDFRANREVVPWMLSSGTLGPQGGWDARLEQLLPGERVKLDRQRWTLTRVAAPIEFKPAKVDRREHAERLASAVESVGRDLKFDAAKWPLPLSGGVDSRGLLHLLRDRNIRTVTWGLSTAPHRTRNDANIARRVAAEFGVENRFFSTNLSQEPRERLVQRFLVAGEGRVANIPPFLDGFSVWKTLHDEGVHGVLRGDQAFGCGFIRNLKDLRRWASLMLLSDHFTAEEVASFDLPDQTLPERLARYPGESLVTWCDRLYQQNRVPRLLAGLTDLKAAYVEVVNPLLAGRILECVRTLPDELRISKRLWKEFVRANGPSVPLARRVAVLPLQNFLNNTAMLELMLAEVESEQAGDLLGPTLRGRVATSLRAALKTDPAKRRRVKTRGPLALIVPDKVRDTVRRWAPSKPELPPTVFAFRAFIVSRMNSLLKADSAALGSAVCRAANL